MMPYRHRLIFSAPFGLTAPTEGADSTTLFTAADLKAEYERGRREGAKQVGTGVEQQFVELRSEVNQVQTGIFARLIEAESFLAHQLQTALPELTLEVAKRVLAGFQPPPEVVQALCQDALHALFPEVEGLELVVGERDRALVESLVPDWVTRYPGIRVTVDVALAPGECLVRSRFGTIDGRRQAKLQALGREFSRP